MIEERGRVVAIGRDGIWVESVSRSACHGCAAKSGCGTGLLGDFWSSASRVYVSATPDLLRGVSLHDTVVIGIAENTLASSALMVYLLPLVFMLAGAIGGEAVYSEPGAIIGAVAGLLGGGMLVRLHSHLNRRNPALVPQLLRVEQGKPCVVAVDVPLSKDR